MSKLKLNVVLSNAESNIEIALMHTGVHYQTKTIVHQVDVKIPDIPERFAIADISIRKEQK